MLAALARGQLDRWMLRPEYPGDEEFHRSVTELLEISAAARRPGYEAVISQVHAYLNEVRQAGT